jgi:dihydroorotate dehydrogenase electron transfer subunit
MENAQVLEHRDIQGGYKRLVLRAPGIAPEVRPGQFVHLRVPHLEAAVLRRPFSVFTADDDSLAILYKDIGHGTAVLKGAAPGETISLIGPLGRGFRVDIGERVPVLVAGGYGMAALYLLARALPARGVAFFGGKTAGDILCVDEFEALGWRVIIATEDGSRGERGLVTVPLDAWLDSGPPGPPEFFACGPMDMLRAIGERAIAGDWKAWLALDRHMGCGVGACLTCVQKIRTPDGGWTWQRVCREGPVFESREIVWEEE